MARLFPKRNRPAGLPPGSLLYTGGQTEKKIRFSLFEYTEETIIEKDDTTIEECVKYLNTPAMTWIQVHGISNPEMIANLGKVLKLHSLFVEDIVSTGQRAKLDVYQDQVFIVARMLYYMEESKNLMDEQISIVFGSNYLISFMEGDKEIFQPIKERLRQGSNRIRKQGVDYLAYSLLDTIVDYYFIVLQIVDDNLDHLEEEVSDYPTTKTMHKIQRAKHEMIILRKVIWPMRDVINRFIRLENSLVKPTTQIYLQDIHDHTVQTIDIIESFRDVVGGMFDIYLSNINIRINDIMKVLTIVSTIFVPLTFISSLYGMNFEYIPGLHSHMGYYITIGLMAFIALSMLLFFRRKKWI